MSSDQNAFLLNTLHKTRKLSFRAMLGTVLISTAFPLAAQDDGSVTQSEDAETETQPVDAPQRPDPISILITVPRGEVNPVETKACEDQADAGTISGEIIVCRQLGEKGDNYASGSREAARKRYAEETAFKGENRSLDVSGGGIFKGPATISGTCIIPPCPPEAAILIDVEALPQAPAGSDADRIARGLPPLGQDEELSEEEIRKRREALGLPPPKYEKDE
ncbi:MAG: hypothetical protein AAGL10_16425 [Pseudomonadota bacterium]